MFWGLFLALAAILAGYVVWMIAVERRAGRDRGPLDAVNTRADRGSSRGPKPPAASPDDAA
jgi:hypothetical protein